MHRLETRLARQWPPRLWQRHGAVVAVSGGPDSVALLRALHALATAGGLPGEAHRALHAGHYHHRLRAGADDDESFVRNLCAELELPLTVEHAQPGQFAKTGRKGPAAAARQARYDFLRRLAESAGCRYVATAHTADDQAETVLHRILRGSGPEGLAAIARQRRLSRSVTLVRPLLDLHRRDLTAYLQEIGQPWQSDPTNRDRRRTRSRIRHQLLPHLRRRYNRRVDDALVRLAALSAEANAWIGRQADDLLERALRVPDVEHGPAGPPPSATAASALPVTLDAAALAAADPFLQRAALRRLWQRQGWPLGAMSRRHWLALQATVADPACGATTLPGGVQVERRGDLLLLHRAAA